MSTATSKPKTTAHAIKDYIATHDVAAYSLSAANGYLYDGRYITFPAPITSERRDNRRGRCIHSVSTYADGSTLTYTYNTNTESCTLKVS